MEEFVAGAAAGVSGLVVGHPMEVLKVQLQVQSGHAVGVLAAAQSMLSRGLTDGIFRGLSLPLVSFTALNSVFFGVYGQTLSGLATLRPDCHHGNVTLAGMAGGAAQLPLATPIEVVKTAMQAQLTRATCGSEFFRGPVHCALWIARREGLRGLHRGFWLTFARDVPSYGLYMLLYDWLARRPTLSHVIGDTAAVLLAGGLSGSVSWLTILPIDTVKSNLQADAGVGASRSGFSVARQLYHEHGVKAFFRGGCVVSVRAFPVNAVTFFVWDRTLQLMRGD